MTSETQINLPLYAFFDALRKNGFSLGIEEYYTLLNAFQLGFGIDKKRGDLDAEKVLKLCKTLWLKPNQSSFIFEDIFRDNFDTITKDDVKIEENNNPQTSISSPENADIQDNREENQEENENNISSQTSDAHPLIKFVLGDAAGEAINISNRQPILKKKFFFSDNYFGLSKRQMQQVCRFLPITQAYSSTSQIDVEGSVQQFAEKGLLAKPVYEDKDRIINKVLLLIDHDGSMLAFEKLTKIFAEAINETFKTHKANNKNKVLQYYFYNTIQEYCYKNKAHTKYDETSQLISQLKNTLYASVIIISDAGAARGGNSDGRFKATLRFILQLKKATNKIVWLNPMPEERWTKTTAQRIARFVPMFSLSTQHDLQKAINVLRKK